LQIERLVLPSIVSVVLAGRPFMSFLAFL
jgi:hypothetical protein